MDTIDLHTALGPFRVFKEGTITRALQEGQFWDDHLIPSLKSAKSGVAIDIGAHFGWFTVWLAKHHHSVIAVEPNPEAFALLQHNVRGWQDLGCRIQCWPVAAYHQPAVLGFDPRNDRTDAGSFAFTADGDNTVVGIPLDRYLPTTANITVIKCDAQGADLRALQGLQKTIRRCRPLIVFEWEEGLSGWHGCNWQDYLDFFALMNYSVERITIDYWDYVARPR